MQRSKIEWLRSADGSQGYTVNPVKGLCPVTCDYCYARRMYKRFHWDETIRYDPWVFEQGPHIPQGSRTFVGSTMELFGPWVPQEWMENIIGYCEAATAHTFIFLTKRPHELKRYNPWPDNCWVGTSVTHEGIDSPGCSGAATALEDVEAKVKFISFEPLLTHVDPAPLLPFCDWVIIGQQTPVKQNIPAWWIADIELEANRLGIPVFHKDNLDIHPAAMRQEFPKC